MRRSEIKDNNYIKVNWESVLFEPELISYLELYSFKQLSLTSKLIRLKLKPLLFKGIVFEGREFLRYLNNEKDLLYLHFLNRWHYSSIIVRNLLENSNFNNLRIESTLQEIEDQLRNVRLFVKNFHFYNIDRAGYYMFSLLNVFENLTKLKLELCTIPISGFNKLSKSMPNLEELIVNGVTFAMLPSIKVENEYVQFPISLKALSIYNCHFCSDEAFSDLEKYLFYKVDIKNSTNLNISSISIPSLLSLEFYNSIPNGDDLNDFFEKNPQIEYLSFNSEKLDQSLINKLEKSKSLKKLRILCKNLYSRKITIPTLQSINQFNFLCVSFDIYLALENLCISSPNLKEIIFVIAKGNINQTKYIIDGILNNIIPKSNNLKILDLYLIGDYNSSITFTNLNQIESLKIRATLDTLLNIKFKNSTTLKYIQYTYDKEYYNASNIREKLLNLDDWQFVFNAKGVKGSRIV